LPIDEVQTHTLYRTYASVDEDWFALSLMAGQGYRIATQALTNGADTEIRLYDASLNLLAINDDAVECSPCSPLHNGENFSSMLEYTAAETATYYVRVRTADAVYTNPAAYGYIGRYGGYSIRLTEQSGAE
jgi:hypothetical protein